MRDGHLEDARRKKFSDAVEMHYTYQSEPESRVEDEVWLFPAAAESKDEGHMF